MGQTTRCARCRKGIGQNDKVAIIDERIYHFKCAERIEKNKK